MRFLTLLTDLLIKMEAANVGSTIWEARVWTPGMWEHGTILIKALAKLEAHNP